MTSTNSNTNSNLPRPVNKNSFNRYRGNWNRVGNKNIRRSVTAVSGSQAVSSVISSKKFPSPYRGWTFYFKDEVFKSNNITHTKIKAMENFIERNKNMFSFNSLLENLSGNIDVKLLKSDVDFITEWSSFNLDLENNPEHTLACLGLAIHQAVYKQVETTTQQDLLNLDKSTLILSSPLIHLRPINYEPITQLKNLKVNCYGKLVSVRGTVIRCSPVKLLCKNLAWKCDNCLQVQTIYQPDGVLEAPSSCPTVSCRSKKFQKLLSDPLTETVDWQTIKLQETVANHQVEGGRIPRTIEVELSSNLVSKCIPGDDITITGILKVQNTGDSSSNRVNSTSANMFALYIDAVSIVNDKNQSNTIDGKNSIAGIEFAVRDYYAIQQIHAEEGLLKLLVQSLCPTIFGQEIVKLGLLLGLFGSGCLNRNDSRSDSHILIVGDPGLGKSQLLQACAHVAPRGVYVCGNTSTNAGLTVSLCRESGGDFALEAGALVLADQGICCIDEFDKMSTQHQALLEAMEQQTISIAKAGVVCTLSARCGILAAANPCGGHYNKAKTVAENIRLSSALLSRFDLIFILLDKPDQHLDTLLSEHVLALHTSVKKAATSTTGSITNNTGNNTSNNMSDSSSQQSLKDRLRLLQGEQLDLIPFPLLRKYIAYARKYVSTRLSPAAAEVLQQFYMKLRREHQTADSTPVTARQLQAMVRLTQARARMELRELATAQDALDIVEVMKHSLVDIFTNDFDQLDFTRSQNGSGISNRSQAKKFLNMLSRYAENKRTSLLELTEIRRIAENGKIPMCDVNNLISSLNLQGFLIKKGNQKYQLLLSQF